MVSQLRPSLCSPFTVFSQVNLKIYSLFMYFLCDQGPPGDRGERGESGDPGYKVGTPNHFIATQLNVLVYQVNIMLLHLRAKLVWTENEADPELQDNRLVSNH